LRVEKRIAGLTPERVVDVAKAVDVHQHQRHVQTVARRRAELVGQPVEEQAAIGQSGQRVVAGEIVDLFFLGDEFQAEGDVPGQLVEQLEFLVVEEIRFRRIQRQNAEGLPSTSTTWGLNSSVLRIALRPSVTWAMTRMSDCASST
jgi:hypothetical protein